MTDVRVALIAGGSGVVGSEVAKLFVANGMHVILAARDSAGLIAVDDELRELGKSATLVQVDFCDFNVVKELASSIASKFGALDVFVSCFGVLGDLSPMQDYEYDMWHSVLQINLSANWYLLKCLDPLLKASKAGRVVFATSKAASNPSAYPYWGPYVVSKSALESMAMVYAAETKHMNLCVNILRPDYIRGGMSSQAFAGKDQDTVEFLPKSVQKFLELASEECSVTGEVFDLENSVPK